MDVERKIIDFKYIDWLDFFLGRNVERSCWFLKKINGV